MQPEGEIIHPHSYLPFVQKMRVLLKRRDRLRRNELGRWSDMKFIVAFPHLYLPRMRVVPEQGIEEEREIEFLVNCSCGAHPIIDRDTEMFKKCPGCERRYLPVDQRLFVLYGAMAIPSAQTVASPEPEPA